MLFCTLSRLFLVNLLQQIAGYPNLPPMLPPMDLSLNRLTGTGLDMSGGRLAGSLTGAFQPKVGNFNILSRVELSNI